MASSFDNDLLEVREGFLCPICHLDLGSSSQLRDHYEVSHSSEEYVGAVNAFRGLLDKAKKKILNRDEDDNSSPEEPSLYQGPDTSITEPQEVGAIRSHMGYFKEVRNSRTDHYVIETNKLLNRLDKILTGMPAEPAKRKAREKSLVMWAADEDVPRCPECTKAFSMTRRRSHCRLCGGIMCGSCSMFITHAYAKKLTNPTEMSYIEKSSIAASTGALVFDYLLSIPRSGSTTSLNSILNSSAEPQICVCVHCKNVLDRHNEKSEQLNFKPEILVLYEKLKSFIDESAQLRHRYLKMINSLTAGETIYTVPATQDLRLNVMKVAECIDALSKKILVLGMKDGDVKSIPRAIQLQRAIYQCSNQYLKDKMLGLPSPPSEEDVNEIRERRKQELQEKIAQERKAAIELKRRAAQRSREASPHKDNPRGRQVGVVESQNGNAVSIDDGWGPDSSAMRAADNEDPILQQMTIIKNYIKQAKQAHKSEEVSMLEANLMELREEYYKSREKLGES